MWGTRSASARLQSPDEDDTPSRKWALAERVPHIRRLHPLYSPGPRRVRRVRGRGRPADDDPGPDDHVEGQGREARSPRARRQAGPAVPGEHDQRHPRRGGPEGRLAPEAEKIRNAIVTA